MGKLFIDGWSVGHFIWGFLSRFAVPLPPALSFLVANVVHIASEWQEVRSLPDGTVKQSCWNQVGDVLVFAIGGAVAQHYVKKNKLRVTYASFVLSSLIVWSTMIYEVRMENKTRKKYFS